MTKDTLDKVVALFKEGEAVRTGDLIGRAHKAGLDESEFWKAMIELEVGQGIVRSRRVPHPKMPGLHIVQWYVKQPDTESVSEL